MEVKSFKRRGWTIITNVKESIYSFIGKPYILKQLKNEEGPFLLHMSDTPEEIYPYVKRIIKSINPQYIVHTGDIVDNIKLQTSRSYLHLYEKGLKRFIDFIENQNITPYYVMGNHDDLDTVIRLSNKGIILKRGVIKVEGCSFFVTHEYEETNIKTDFYLFGHAFEPFHYEEENRRVLNGLLNMNIISLSTRKVYQLNYPLGVNYYRKMERRSIGL